MRKKLFTLTVLLLVAAMLFTACSAKTGVSDDSTTKTEGAKADTGDEAGKAAGLKGELVYWSMWNETEPQAMVIKDAIDDFMKVNPGVKISAQWNGREIRKTLRPALDAGQTIDIWDEDPERFMADFQVDLLKLDDYVTKTYPTTDKKAYKDSVMGSLIELARSVSSDGGLYTIPYQPFMFTFMYNKEHFEKAGISTVPKTWAEFMDTCEKLKAAGFIPLTCDDAYIDMLAGYHFARHMGLSNVEELVKDKTGAKWDDAKVLKAAKEIEALASKGYVSSQIAANKWPAGQQEVGTGSVSMYLNGTWLVNEIMGTTGPEFKWGQFAYPTVEGGVDGLDAANYGSQGFFINKKCKSPDAAFNFLVFMTTGKWDKELAAKTYGVPVGGTTEWPSQLADAKGLFNNLKVRYPWSIGLGADTDKFPIVAANFTKLISGNIKAEEFIANCKTNK